MRWENGASEDSDLTTDIFRFWAEVKPDDHVHPADAPVFSRVKNHGFDLRCLPGCFAGPLRTAPVVLLYLSFGLSEGDIAHAQTSAGRELWARGRTGDQPLGGPDEHRSGWRWWSSRTKNFGDWRELRSRVAILNIGAYHSRKFSDHALLAALPSSRVSLDWAQGVLFPEAIAGKRVAVCLRAAHFWGLREGEKYGRALFAPPVTRGGYMRRGPMREEVIRSVRAILNASEERGAIK